MNRIKIVPQLFLSLALNLLGDFIFIPFQDIYLYFVCLALRLTDIDVTSQWNLASC